MFVQSMLGASHLVNKEAAKHSLACRRTLRPRLLS